MMPLKTKEEVAELLRALGTTKEEVSRNLAGFKVTGERRSCSRCPIAKYLVKREAGPIVAVSGDDECLYLTISMSPDLEDTNYRFDLLDYKYLQGVTDFICAFDCGDYPTLDEFEPRFTDSCG